MKKISLFAAMILAFGITASAYYTDAENISIQLENQTNLNIVSKDEAAFSVSFDLKEKESCEYQINYIIGEKEFSAGTVSVEPYKEITKTFNIDVPYGKHELTVIVKRENKEVKRFIADLCVAEKYTPQFMDKFNLVGVCTHFGHKVSDLETNSYNTETFDFLEFAGIKKIRDGLNPAHVVSGKDGYNAFETNYSKNTKWWMDKIVKDDYDVYQPVMGFSNYDGYRKHPTDIKTEGSTPRTPGAIASYGDMWKYLLKTVPGDKEVGIWNEPNINTQWKPQDGKSSSDYANLVKQTSLTVRSEFIDSPINAFTCANTDVPWMTVGFEMGLYPYIDSIDYHWYSNPEPEESKFEAKVEEMVEDTNVKWGGWLRKVASELGVSVTRAGTEENQARRLFKEIMILHELNICKLYIYDFVNDGKNLENLEHNFGTLTQDKIPKNAYLMLNRYNTEFAGAIYVGMVDLGKENVYAYLFIKDGKAKMVVWCHSIDRTATAQFEVGGADVRDYYGNTIAKNASSITVGNTPYIIDNLSDEWVATAVLTSITKKSDKWLEDYREQLPADIILKAEEIFNKTKVAYQTVISAEDSKLIFDEHFELGSAIIAEGKKGNISELLTSQSLYELYKIVMPQNCYYIYKYDGNVKHSIDYAETQKLVDNKYRDDVTIMQYTDKIFRTGKDYYDDAVEVSAMEGNPMKAGVISGYSLMADALFGWVREFSEFEQILEYGYTIQVPGYDLIAFANQEKNIRMALRNQTKKDFTGTVQVLDEKGNKVYETKTITLKAGATIEHPFVLQIPEPENDAETLTYIYAMVDTNGKTVTTQKFITDVKKSVEVKVISCDKTPGDIKNIKVKVKNLRDESSNFTLSFTTQEGLKLAVDSMDVTLDAEAEKILEVPVTSMGDTKFHFYPLSYVAKDESGAEIAKADTLLNFTCIPKAEKPIDVQAFDGNIDDWYDAFPIYIGAPDNVTSYEDWNNSDIAVRMFLKWDENNFYLLADVYDEIHQQRYLDTNMWQGDCIQIGIDPYSEKTANYKAISVSNIYELGVSKAEFENDFWCWVGNAEYAGYETWTKIIRDDEKCNTRYLLAIPKSVLSRLELKEGTKFGYNFAVNDCDVLSRDVFMEYTLGLASSKNASFWDTFELISPASAEYIEGLAKETFK